MVAMVAIESRVTGVPSASGGSTARRVGMNFPFFQWQSLKTRLTLFTVSVLVLGIWLLAFYARREAAGSADACPNASSDALGGQGEATTTRMI